MGLVKVVSHHSPPPAQLSFSSLRMSLITLITPITLTTPIALITPSLPRSQQRMEVPDVEWWDARILAEGRGYDDAAGPMGDAAINEARITAYVEHPGERRVMVMGMGVTATLVAWRWQRGDSSALISPV